MAKVICLGGLFVLDFVCENMNKANPSFANPFFIFKKHDITLHS